MDGAGLREAVDAARGVEQGPARPSSTPASAHLREIAFPHPRASQVENPSGLGPAYERLERSLDRPRICLLAAQPRGFGEEILPKHKIGALHVYRLRTAPTDGKAFMTVDGRRPSEAWLASHPGATLEPRRGWHTAIRKLRSLLSAAARRDRRGQG